MFDCSQICIDRESGELLYIQLVREICRLIREINPEKYDVLPSERFLCQQLDVNRSTVHKAYEELENSGIVWRRPDKSLMPYLSARKNLEGYLRAIGIVLPHRFSQYINEQPHALRLFEGIFDRAAERNYAVLMLELPAPDASEAERRDFICRRLQDLTGILLIGDRGYENDPMLDDLFNYSGIPYVAICGEVHLPHIGSVQCCSRNAVDDMMDFFRKNNVSSVGVVSCASGHFFNTPYDYSASHRDQNMKKRLKKGGFYLPEKWQINADFKPEDLPDELPDAFWCFNDQCALRLQEVLKERDDFNKVIICGFDGVIPVPGAATIAQPYREIGATAVDLLIEHFEHGISSENRMKYIDAKFLPPTK